MALQRAGILVPCSTLWLGPRPFTIFWVISMSTGSCRTAFWQAHKRMKRVPRERTKGQSEKFQ
jgi:hypothetical protein